MAENNNFRNTSERSPLGGSLFRISSLPRLPKNVNAYPLVGGIPSMKKEAILQNSFSFIGMSVAISVTALFVWPKKFFFPQYIGAAASWWFALLYL